MRYKSHSATDRIAVFSEVFYAPDWRVYIDGKPADYFRANYILRAMVVPAGDHEIEFRNEAPRLHELNAVTRLMSFVLLFVLIALLLFYIVNIRPAETAREATSHPVAGNKK